MTIEPNSITLTYGPLSLPTELRGTLLGPRVRDERLWAATRTHLRHLLLLFAADFEHDPQPTFNLCLKTAFFEARRRSVQGHAVAENQAAIVALGVLLGHPAVENLVGPVIEAGDRDLARRILDRVPLHGRCDWTRHFCISAVNAVFSGREFSDAIGQFKETLDTAGGGSGFSFADLLADTAGTVLALSATRDEAAARAMQDRLAGGFRIEDVVPKADGLPEGVSDAELQSRYGGVGGEPYRRLIEEIEHRVMACAAYR